MMSDERRRRQFLAKGLTFGTALFLSEAILPKCMRAALAGEAPQGTLDCEKLKALEDLAYCGFDCQAQCPVYEATRNNDIQVKKEFAKRWADGFGAKVKPEDVACDGCRSSSGRLGYHCENICDVRKCAMSRGVRSCAVCDDFPSCEKQLWNNWLEMRQRTEARRKSKC
jgi:hypothetical protein